MRGIAFALIAFGLVLALLGAWILQRPDLGPWQARHELAPSRCARGPEAPACVEVQWLGVATLVFDDGRTRLLTDGFFSRPGLGDLVFGRPVSPDLTAIEDGLRRAGVDRADAVMTVHSHYDHAMDAPEVVRRTGARLLGSRSTAMVGRGAGLGEDRLVEVEPGRAYDFGDFAVVFHRSRHVPLPLGQGHIGAELSEPLVPPVPIDAYVEGGSFTIEIRHPAGVALVQGSAGFVEGALEGVTADVVLLGVGGFSGQDETYREGYYRELVDRVGARRVVPIHWDDFTEPPGEVVPFPTRLDDVEATLRELEGRAERSPGLEMALLPAWEPVVLLGD